MKEETTPKYKVWSAEEEEYLVENWGKATFKQLCIQLNRSKDSIRRKAMRMELGRSIDCSGRFLTVYRVSQLLGKKRESVLNWEKKGLKIVTSTISGNKNYVIKIPDLLIWLEKNQDQWNSLKLEPFAFGIEPEWLKQKRRDDLSSRTLKNYNKKWKTAEDMKIAYLYKKGMSPKEIFEEVDRTKTAIERRLNRIDVWNM